MICFAGAVVCSARVQAAGGGAEDSVRLPWAGVQGRQARSPERVRPRVRGRRRGAVGRGGRLRDGHGAAAGRHHVPPADAAAVPRGAGGAVGAPRRWQQPRRERLDDCWRHAAVGGVRRGHADGARVVHQWKPRDCAQPAWL